jgi:hypothetical protein
MRCTWLRETVPWKCMKFEPRTPGENESWRKWFCQVVWNFSEKSFEW